MAPELTARIAVGEVTYWVDRPYTYAVPEKLAGLVRPGMRVAVPFGGSRPREGVVLAMGGQTDKRLKPILEVLDAEPLLSETQLKLALWMRERFFCTVMDAVRTMLPAGLWYSVWPVYRLAEGLDADSAYDAAAGRSERLVLDAVTGHGGRCELADIEAVFGTKNPGPALAALVKKGVLCTEAGAARRAGDKTILRAALAVTPEQAAAQAAKSSRAVRQAAVLQVLSELGQASVADLCYFTGAGRDTVRRLAEKGLVTLSREPVYRRPDYAAGSGEEPLPELNRAQSEAFRGILALADGKAPQAALLYGVTGSGKTAIYLHLIHEMLRRGKSAIFLVPEIALTPQMLQTFSSHFGERIAVLHSSLSMGERYDEWKRIRDRDARVVIGTRSAIFAPAQDLGAVIIDEEQEDTYKSESGPRYHARDVAKFLCARSNALLLLGSATPDVRSRYYAETGRYSLFTLPERYNAMHLPQVRIADMRRELKAGNNTSISSLLREELQENISRGEQSILFINRRGASKLVTCLECGYTYKCPNCTASLTYHSVGSRLMCHYCGHTQRVDAACPACGGRLSYVGTGTQRVVQELGELFPDTPVLRMDTDAVAPVGSHRTLFEQFRVQRIPILVGTQMVTKGLNFENVTLVGVLNADQGLYSSEYRAGERTFSLITQVIGRSGRFDKPGRAVIQTFTPANQIIRQAALQDYDSFYQSEIALRRLAGTPPFSDLFMLTASGVDETAVVRCCGEMRSALARLLRDEPEARILGPAPLPVAKVMGAWRYRVTVCCTSSKAVRAAVDQALMLFNDTKRYRGVSVYADFDPLN